MCVRYVAEPANQAEASKATPEPIHNNNTDIIEIDESTTIFQIACICKVTDCLNREIADIDFW